MADTVALIGMGLRGSALAENLLAAGFTVRGYDLGRRRHRLQHHPPGRLRRAGRRARAPGHRAMDIKGKRMLDGDYEPEGKLAQHLKDVELILEVGHAAGAPLLAPALHRQLLLAGVAGGFGERDNSSIMAVLRALIAGPR